MKLTEPSQAYSALWRDLQVQVRERRSERENGYEEVRLVGISEEEEMRGRKEETMQQTNSWPICTFLFFFSLFFGVQSGKTNEKLMMPAQAQKLLEKKFSPKPANSKTTQNTM